jgi:hypothetical protein
MIDMKLSPQQSPGSTMLGGAEANEGPVYPHGLEIVLTHESLQKLAVGALPQVGQTLTIQAITEVVNVGKTSNQIAESRTVTLQITAMEIVQDKDPAAQLYG